MGAFTCADAVVEFDDRTLTHLQVVVMRKFRRGEAFAMAWVDSPSIGSGRGALWLTPAVPVLFRFDGSRIPAIDRAWLGRLAAAAEGPGGLLVTDEDGVVVKAKGLGHRPIVHRLAS